MTNEIYVDNSCRIIYFTTNDMSVIKNHIFNSLNKGIKTIKYFKNTNSKKYIEINIDNVNYLIKDIK